MNNCDKEPTESNPVLSEDIERVLPKIIKKIQSKNIYNASDMAKGDKYKLIQLLFGDDKESVKKLKTQCTNHSKLDKNGLPIKFMELIINQLFSQVWWETHGRYSEASWNDTSMSMREVKSWVKFAQRNQKEKNSLEMEVMALKEEKGFFTKEELDAAVSDERERSFDIWDAEKVDLKKQMHKIRDEHLALKNRVNTGVAEKKITELRGLVVQRDEYIRTLEQKLSLQSQDSSGESVTS